ncbi:hypothetical protein LH651_00205 [Mycoplasma hominis]|uniref:ribonuclease III domain-containing protein n=1 Tax=Metamycoplasma hominis TaxID=2098 RepID=UPI001F467583|nr:ribonuclease III domain-containing protein [Metamycoplasma hominis]MCF1354699.1 hypothetical protein [Metamycoplasma hominis]
MGIEEWQEYIYQIEYTIGYSFKNKFLLYQAFTRSSYSNQYGVENNEVLEFIGDSVWSFCVVQLMAEKFGFLKSASQYYNKYEDLEEYCLIANENESDFTDLKNQIVSNKTLAKKINKLGFAKYLVLGDNDKRNNVANQDSVKADLFEAIIGAIAIDSGWDIKRLKNIIIKMLDIEHFFRDVDCRGKRPNKFKLENAINTLKELAEHGECSMPIYEISEKPIIDNNGKQQWKCICNVRSWNFSNHQWTGLSTKHMEGYGSSKKLAKKMAAYIVLCDHYGLPNEYKN